jgi:tRNA-2-methylthio-N6-dimethylallyladenosine synthase
MPNCAISTDMMTGFCGETGEDHADTVSIMKEVDYEFAYMFKYSERPKTLADRKFEDDVPEEVKQKRLEEIIEIQHESSHKRNKASLGKTFEVLVEGVSKKSDKELYGRNSQNAVVVFERGDIKPGTFVNVKVTDCTSATLLGEAVE